MHAAAAAQPQARRSTPRASFRRKSIRGRCRSSRRPGRWPAIGRLARAAGDGFPPAEREGGYGRIQKFQLLIQQRGRPAAPRRVALRLPRLRRATRPTLETVEPRAADCRNPGVGEPGKPQPPKCRPTPARRCARTAGRAAYGRNECPGSVQHHRVALGRTGLNSTHCSRPGKLLLPPSAGCE